ncbi:uncharacterized protein LOC141616886 [Silene latifolia]|uniref:uncharacterized protein LOC141616886 n=1 Tax=Silene latifolia TaxID=37657 RepID=UPI003D7787B4
MLFTEDSVNKILAIPLSETQCEDKVFWPHTGSGVYSVKSGYGIEFERFFDQIGTERDKVRISEQGRLFCKTKLWRLPGLNTWKIFLWKIISNSLPVGEEFERRGLAWDQQCVLCTGEIPEMESLEHLFRDCEVSARLWAGSPLGIRSDNIRSLKLGDWVINWIKYLERSDRDGLSVLRFVAMLSAIWNMRNNIRFRGERLPPSIFYRCWESTVSLTKSACSKKEENKLNASWDVEGNEGRSVEFKAIKEGQPVYLVNSGNGCHMKRIMVDVGWDISRLASFGWCFQNEEGVIEYEGKAKGRAENPLQAETKGFKMALEWARMKGILHLEISSDCLQLVNQLAGLGSVHHYIGSFVEEIMELSSSFHCLCVSFIPRDLNCRAHKLAEEARTM